MTAVDDAPVEQAAHRRIVSREGESSVGKGILLWLIGVPIPVIILLWLLFR